MGQPPFLFQNVSAAADLKSCASCLLRDSAARKGWVISHRYCARLEGNAVNVGTGMPANTGTAVAMLRAGFFAGTPAHRGYMVGATNLYPTPGSVMMNRGAVGSSPSFCRRCPTTIRR